jgi:hypothetical protein
MQDRSEHWNQAEHLLGQAGKAGYGGPIASDMIDAAAVHAMLATGNQPIDLDLDRGPGETLAQLAARTAKIARRVAATAAEISADALAHGGSEDIALSNLGERLALSSQDLARIADQIRAHLA